MKNYKRKLSFLFLLEILLVFAILFSICTFIHVKGKRLKDKADFYFQQGVRFLYKGDYKNALRNFEEAGRLCPKSYRETSKDIIAALDIIKQLHEWREEELGLVEGKGHRP